MANLAIDSGGYVSGKLYGLCLTASVCWFVWIPIQAAHGPTAEETPAISDDGVGSRPSLWAMAVVVMISIPIAWELLRHDENAGLRTLRLLVAAAIIVCLASAAYVKEYFDRRESVRESEQRFRLAAQTGKMYSFEWSLVTDEVIRSPEHASVLGRTAPLRDTHTEFVQRIHADDRAKLTSAIAGLTPEKPTAEVIYRLHNSDGALMWLRSNGRGFFDSEGKLLRVSGMAADITDLKRAEEALLGVTRKLVEAQEQERARIGRELHDDINQRLAMLSVELERLGDSQPELHGQVQELREELRQISDDVHGMSHDLHSPNLEYLGAIAGMKSWCKEVARRRNIEIAFSSDFSGTLPRNVVVPLFRVLQEAVNNAIKHSGEKRIEVQVGENSGEIHLIIGDSGRGFDVETAMQGNGLGLTSMRERVRLVNGTIAIESKPMGGTHIHVRIAWEQGSSATRLSA